MQMTTTVNSGPEDIRTFYFTHLEMCIISVALSSFQLAATDNHLNRHIETGQCNKGEANIITMIGSVQDVLSSQMIPERMEDLFNEILAGKYS